MKKLLYLIIALMLCMPVYAQRGGSNTRSSSPSRTSVSTRTSTRTSSPSRSSTATYRSSSPSRSSASVRSSSPSRSSISTRTSSSSRGSYSPSRTSTQISRPAASIVRTTPSRAETRPADRPHHNVNHPVATHNYGHHHGHHHHIHMNGHTYRPHHTFYHPIYHRHIYMRPVYWDPWIWPTKIYWYGWWNYCYTYPTHDIIVVKQYVKDTYNKEIIAYTVYNEYIYSIVKEDGYTYLEIFSNEDELVYKHSLSRKYIDIVADTESDGVWILKKNGKDPIFVGHDDTFYIYETN